MRRLALLSLILVLAMYLSAAQAKPITVASPNGDLEVTLAVPAESNPRVEVRLRDVLIATADLGMEFAESGRWGTNVAVTDVRRRSHDETYSIPVGKTSAARDQHNAVTVALRERSVATRAIDIEVRVFNDGVALRYIMPRQETLKKFVITDELTHLSFPGNPLTRALPLGSFTSSYEAYYETARLKDLAAGKLIGLPILLERPLAGDKAVWMAVTEADLTDYAGMYLVREEGDAATLRCKLSPLPGRKDGARVIGTTPHSSPWRVIMVADTPGQLIESNVVFNLNPPSAIKDTSWIKPGKTTFGWWNHYVLEGVRFQPGVNTATMKHYIDFCAEQGIPMHTLDGLDIAWYGGPIAPFGPTDITTSAPSIDMDEVIDYARQKGVRLRLWLHWKALRPQIDEAFALYEKWGIEGVMVDFMNRDDQEMVRWYHEVARKAAQHHLTVTWHGAYKPTGMERTWPNVLSYEAVLNQEYNKWQTRGGQGASPGHNLNVAFVRMLAGPLDYHQGGMRNVLPSRYEYRNVAPFVQGTRGHQLAMYVVYQNHLPMLVDYPEAYRGQDGLRFLVDVPTTWDETRVLHAEIGKCMVIARRKGEIWYVGGMTADEPRRLALQTGVLGNGPFDASCLTDDPLKGPTGVRRRAVTVSAGDSLDITMPANGGFVARLESHVDR